MAKKSDYLGLSYVVSLILTIFIPTAWILGIIVRFQERKYVAAIIRIFFGFNIIWILDIIYMAWKKHICRFLNV